jgi:SAM-dependent methyltransferase
MSKLEFASQLEPDEYGIYRGKNSQAISYPAGGNEKCFLLEDSSFWFQHRNSCITAAISSFPPSGPIIDLGGGNGYVTRALLDAGFDAVLLEPGPEGAMNGKISRQIPTVICSTFQDAGFEDSSLNAIGCFDVIEHMEEDRAFMEQAFSVLVPGGFLYATVPAHQCLWSHSDDAAHHHRRYKRAMIEQLLDNRFEILYFSYIFGFLTLPVLVFRAIPYRLGISKNNNVLSENTEHGTGQGSVVRLLNWRLKKEQKRIVQGDSIRFGASCLFVARSTK